MAPSPVISVIKIGQILARYGKFQAQFAEIERLVEHSPGRRPRIRRTQPKPNSYGSERSTFISGAPSICSSKARLLSVPSPSSLKGYRVFLPGALVDFDRAVKEQFAHMVGDADI